MNSDPILTNSTNIWEIAAVKISDIRKRAWNKLCEISNRVWSSVKNFFQKAFDWVQESFYSILDFLHLRPLKVLSEDQIKLLNEFRSDSIIENRRNLLQPTLPLQKKVSIVEIKKEEVLSTKEFEPTLEEMRTTLKKFVADAVDIIFDQKIQSHAIKLQKMLEDLPGQLKEVARTLIETGVEQNKAINKMVTDLTKISKTKEEQEKSQKSFNDRMKPLLELLINNSSLVKGVEKLVEQSFYKPKPKTQTTRGTFTEVNIVESPEDSPKISPEIKPLQKLDCKALKEEVQKALSEKNLKINEKAIDPVLGWLASDLSQNILEFCQKENPEIKENDVHVVLSLALTNLAQQTIDLFAKHTESKLKELPKLLKDLMQNKAGLITDILSTRLADLIEENHLAFPKTVDEVIVAFDKHIKHFVASKESTKEFFENELPKAKNCAKSDPKTKKEETDKQNAIELLNFIEEDKKKHNNREYEEWVLLKKFAQEGSNNVCHPTAKKLVLQDTTPLYKNNTQDEVYDSLAGTILELLLPKTEGENTDGISKLLDDSGLFSFLSDIKELYNNVKTLSPIFSQDSISVITGTLGGLLAPETSIMLESTIETLGKQVVADSIKTLIKKQCLIPIVQKSIEQLTDPNKLDQLMTEYVLPLMVDNLIISLTMMQINPQITAQNKEKNPSNPANDFVTHLSKLVDCCKYENQILTQHKEIPNLELYLQKIKDARKAIQTFAEELHLPPFKEDFLVEEAYSQLAEFCKKEGVAIEAKEQVLLLKKEKEEALRLETLLKQWGKERDELAINLELENYNKNEEISMVLEKFFNQLKKKRKEKLEVFQDALYSLTFKACATYHFKDNISEGKFKELTRTAIEDKVLEIYTVNPKTYSQILAIEKQDKDIKVNENFAPIIFNLLFDIGEFANSWKLTGNLVKSNVLYYSPPIFNSIFSSFVHNNLSNYKWLTHAVVQGMQKQFSKKENVKNLLLKEETKLSMEEVQKTRSLQITKIAELFTDLMNFAVKGGSYQQILSVNYVANKDELSKTMSNCYQELILKNKIYNQSLSFNIQDIVVNAFKESAKKISEENIKQLVSEKKVQQVKEDLVKK